MSLIYHSHTQGIGAAGRLNLIIMYYLPVDIFTRGHTKFVTVRMRELCLTHKTPDLSIKKKKKKLYRTEHILFVFIPPPSNLLSHSESPFLSQRKQTQTERYLLFGCTVQGKYLKHSGIQVNTNWQNYACSHSPFMCKYPSFRFRYSLSLRFVFSRLMLF